MLRRHIGQQIDVHLPLPQAHYTLVGIKSLLKIGEAGVLAARGGVAEPLKPSPGYAHELHKKVRWNPALQTPA